MTEILVATASAGWLIGTELSAISLLGGLVIIAAVCIDLCIKRGARETGNGKRETGNGKRESLPSVVEIPKARGNCCNPKHHALSGYQ